MLHKNSTRKLKVSWKEIHKLSRALAQLLKSTGTWDKIVAITRGGLIPAAIVAKELDIKIIDTVSIQSYNKKRRGKLNILKSSIVSKGTILLIDDIVDTGQTATTVTKMFPKAHFASIYVQPSGKNRVDSFIKEIDGDIWVVFPWEPTE